MVISIVGLDFCVPELIWTIITFFVLMFLLKTFLYKPVLRILDERKANVEAGLAEGKKAEKALADTSEALDKELFEQNDKARELISKAIDEAEEAKEKTVSEAHAEAEILRKNASELISSEEDKAVNELDATMPELVMLLTNKLLGSEEAKDSSELIRSCVEESKGN